MLAARNDYNFDHPDAFDFDLLTHTLRKLKQGKSVKIPVYDFTTHGRQKEWKTVYGASVIIFEGIMSFADKALLQLLDMKIFVETDSDIRLVRRLRRDITERGRDIEGVIKQYNKFVKPAFEQYIEPTMRLADLVVPRAGETMEPALRAVCKDVRIGKILIQTNQDTGEPEVHGCTNVAHVTILHIPSDHDVQEDKILLVSLLMAEMGVHSVAYAFPQVKIITTAVDKKVNDVFHIIPGIGNFGDRYFGTDAPPDWSDEDIDKPSC
ncbi:hypothetical protein XENOCAPTIV_007787 [Xenoophorus captivus]|uniref:uridine/cytidine kinase n=1 Tax=Xenoophorus captivus TaxID=1517983 RepID=A0ABV0R9C9_9TELE